MHDMLVTLPHVAAEPYAEQVNVTVRCEAVCVLKLYFLPLVAADFETANTRVRYTEIIYIPIPVLGYCYGLYFIFLNDRRDISNSYFSLWGGGGKCLAPACVVKSALAPPVYLISCVVIFTEAVIVTPYG